MEWRSLLEKLMIQNVLDAQIFDLYARESEITDVQAATIDEPEDKNVKDKVLKMEKERLREKVS